MREILLTLGLGVLIGVAYLVGRREKKRPQLVWSPQPRRVDEAMN